MTREEAWALLCEWTENDALRKHALAVEAAMRFYAQKFGEDPDEWGIVGLLHDFDYEKYPTMEEHPYKGVEHLRSIGVPESWCEAILAHAPYTGQKAESTMAKSLLASDELTGLIVATTLVQPSKKIADLKPKSVKKRMKEKAFAKKVNREDIIQGAEMLGIPLEEHIENVVNAMRDSAEALGL
ncbi:HDIG domain-containing protein [bacterium]|nr:MAG: HDIG domain-containing protein [bacterium]